MKSKTKIYKFQIPCTKCGLDLSDCVCVRKVIVKSQKEIQKNLKERKTISLGKYYSKDDVIALIDKALRHGYSFSDAMSDACSITEYAENNYREAFDKFIEANLK